MKFILLSDFHLLGNNPSGRIDDLVTNQFKKLRYIFKYASHHDYRILQAGDLSDIPRSWFLLVKLAIQLRKFRKVNLFSIFGQHDTYLYSELTRDATTLGVLNKTGLLTLLSEEPMTVGNSRLYGCSFGTKVPKVPEKLDGIQDVLVIHRNISDVSLFHRHKFAPAKKFLKKYKDFDLILAGDIHRKFKIKLGKRRLVNTGPILRVKNTDYNQTHKPGFYVWDDVTNKLKWIKIPHEKAADVFVPKRMISTEGEQEKLILSIEAIRNSSNIKKFAELSEILLSLYKENDIDENVQELLAELLN